MFTKTARITRISQIASLLLGLASTASAWAGNPSFADQQAFTTDSYPYGVAMGDINGDGKADMVTSNNGDGTVSVMFNTTPANASTPSFAPQAVFAVGSYPVAVTIADVNGDGLLDIITANSGDNTITILLNTTVPGATTPSFAAPQVIQVGSDPQSVIAADLNGDGKLDLAVANYADETITVLLNATTPGAGTVDFSNQQTFFTPAAPFQLVAADMNGDGSPDLVAVNFGNANITVMLNTTAQGSMTPSFADPQYFDDGGEGDGITLAVADVNGDGSPDVAVADMASNSVQVLVNTTVPGSAIVSFAPIQSFAVGNSPVSLIAVDVDGDNMFDLVTANSVDNSLTVLHNTTVQGSATLSFSALTALAVGSVPQSLTTADVNGDGKPDLIDTNDADLSVSVVLNTTP